MPGVLIRGELVELLASTAYARSSNKGGTSRPVQLMPGVLIRGELVD